MSDNENGNGSKIRTRFNELQSDVRTLKILLNKLDRNVDKLADASVEVSKLVSQHEIRIENSLKRDEILNADIQDINLRILDIHKDIKSVVEKLQKADSTNVEGLSNRIQNIEKWKWYAAGAILAIAMGMEYQSIAQILVKIFN